MSEAVLPAAVPTPVGAVAVLYVTDHTFEDFGHTDLRQRHILIKSGMHADVQWMTLYHEWLHVILWDHGVELDEDREERVCNALAHAMVALGRAGRSLPGPGPDEG